MATLTIRLSDAHRDRLAAMAARRGLSLDKLMEELSVSMTTENCTFLTTENCTLSRGREGGRGGDAVAEGAAVANLARLFPAIIGEVPTAAAVGGGRARGRAGGEQRNPSPGPARLGRRSSFRAANAPAEAPSVKWM